MSRVVMFILFLAMVSIVFFFMHYFVFKSLTKYLILSRTARHWVKVFFWISALSWPLGMAASRLLRVHFLNHYGYIWLGILSIAFSFFILQRLLTLVWPSHGRWLTLIILGLILVSSSYSLFNGLRSPLLRRIELPVQGLPAAMSGFKLVHLSDLHLEDYKTTRGLEDLVDRLNALAPDVVVVTGDLIDSNICERASYCASLSRLSSRYGVFAVTGNHEFYVGMDVFDDFAARAGIRILRNEVVTLDGAIQLVGWDDDESARFKEKRPPLAELLQRCDPDKPTVLLYHRPTHFAEAVAGGVDLQLSGHTHAGQIPPLDFLVWLVYRYPAGLFHLNGAHIYTSAGTGYWGPPMRLFNRSEFVEFTLIPAS